MPSLLDPAIRVMLLINGDLKHDPWGTAMAVGGAICDVLWAHGEEHRIPAAAGYRPAPSWRQHPSTFTYDEATGENGDQDHMLAEIRAGVLSFDALEYGIKVIDRYLNLVRAAGKDY